MIDLIQTNQEKILLRDVRVLDVSGSALSNPTDVFIVNGIIDDLDSHCPTHDCHIIECGGLTLAPGLIDCHCHILSPFVAEQSGIFGAWALRQIKLNLKSTLASGVVCVRDMLSPIKIMNHYRRAITSGRLPGPRILASGPILTCRGGYPEFVKPVPAIAAAFIGQPRINIETPDRAAAAIINQKKHGINVVKVAYTILNTKMEREKRMPTISKKTLDAICETSHAIGLKVSVHHFCADDLPEILCCDIDSVEHLPCDREFTGEEVEFIRRSGVTVVPTLTISESAVRYEEKTGFLNSERAAEMFEPRVLQYLKLLADTWLDFSDPEYLLSFGATRGKRGNHRNLLRNAARLCEAGVKFCAGTDMGAVISFPGETADESLRLNHIGMSKIEAIRAVTLEAAKLLGIDDKIGSVEPGKDADVILIEGNPLEDLVALKRVRIIGKGGRWYRSKYSDPLDFWPGFGPLMEYRDDK
ncbi:MAG: amidohydrolase family protein [bacterium]